MLRFVLWIGWENQINVNIGEVSKIAGNGVPYIEQHYRHSTHEVMEKEVFKRENFTR